MTYAALIFTHSITPRLGYVVDFLSRYYDRSFRLTSDEEYYLKSAEDCKINYSYHRLVPGEIFIHPHALLSESYIRTVKIECFEQHGHPVFFKTEGDTGFDLFAGVFYLLSRYEEYLPHAKDSLGRFPHEVSIAYKNNFLHLPLVNIWLEDFRDLLSQKNHQFNNPASEFEFLPTYDIDMAWSFRNKGFKRNAGGMLLLLLKARFGKIVQRIHVLQGKRPDPFDAYEWMDQLYAQYKLHPIYFFLVAKETGRHDKNIDVHHPEFRELVQRIAACYDIGLHPSWASNDVPSLLEKEKQILEQLSQKKINTSRHHFIRFHLPESYQRLLAQNIINDHSMGYGSINGFRASVASSFYWYDLKNEVQTALLVHPFCFMDANSFYEQGLSPAEALDELKAYHHIIRSVRGKMITIWHNSFLGTDEAFAGWRDTYEQFISSCVAS